MTDHRVPALALASLLLASLCAFPLPAAATSCSASAVNTPPSCGFECRARNSPIVSADSEFGVEVRGKVRCHTTEANCRGYTHCHTWGPGGNRTVAGTCEGWSATARATVTCIAGHGAHMLALGVGGGCRAELYALLDLSFVAVVEVGAEAEGGRDSFIWSPAGGCVQVVPDCYDVGYSSGPKGLLCGIGPGFAWRTRG